MTEKRKRKNDESISPFAQSIKDYCLIPLCLTGFLLLAAAIFYGFAVYLFGVSGRYLYPFNIVLGLPIAIVPAIAFSGAINAFLYFASTKLLDMLDWQLRDMKRKRA